MPLSLAEEIGRGGGATQPHQQSAEELQTYSYSYRRVGQIITVFRFEHFPIHPLRLFLFLPRATAHQPCCALSSFLHHHPHIVKPHHA